MGLLRNHCLEKCFIFLHATERLIHGVKLGGERLERVGIRRFLFGKHAKILLLESLELGILFVEVPL